MRPEPDRFAVLDETLARSVSSSDRIIADAPHEWITAYAECHPEKTEAVLDIASPFFVPPHPDQDVETLIRSLLLGRNFWKPGEAFRMPFRWLGMPWLKPLLDEFGVQTLENPDDSKMATVFPVSIPEVRRLHTAESLSAFLNRMGASSLGRRIRWTWKQVLSGRASSDLIDSLESALIANLPAEPDENAFVVFSPESHADRWMSVPQIPGEGFGLFDDAGESVPFQTIETKNGLAILFRFQSDGIGFRFFRFKPVQNETSRSGMSAGRFFLENDLLRVDVRPNGLVDVTDKSTGNRFRGLNAPSISGKSIKPTSVRLSLVASGPLRGAIKIRMRLKPPKAPHGSTEVVKIWSTVKLGAGDGHIEFETEIENPFEESVSPRFPTNCVTRQSRALIGFGRTSRESIRAERRGPDETWMQHGIIWVLDENRGLALMTSRPGPYRFGLDARRTLSIENKTRKTNRTILEYGLAPFDPANDPDGTAAFQIWKTISRPPMVFGKLALKTDPPFVKVEPQSLLVSFKVTEDGEGFIIRLWNSTAGRIQGRIKLKPVVSEVWLCGLDEVKRERITVHEDSITISVNANTIETIRFK